MWWSRTEQNRTERSPFVCLFLKRSRGTKTEKEKVIDKGGGVVGLTDYVIIRIVHFLWSESWIGSDQCRRVGVVPGTSLLTLLQDRHCMWWITFFTIVERQSHGRPLWKHDRNLKRSVSVTKCSQQDTNAALDHFVSVMSTHWFKKQWCQEILRRVSVKAASIHRCRPLWFCPWCWSGKRFPDELAADVVWDMEVCQSQIH